MITWDDVVSIVRNRQMNNGELLEKMIEVRRRYNSDWVIPYVSEHDDAVLPPTTPALIAEAIDFLGMRAASVMPYMNSPAIDPTKEVGVRSREYGAIRRKILGATHHQSKTKLHMRRAMRHLAGYATASMIVVPDFDSVAVQPQLQLASKPYFETTVYDFAAKLLNLIVNHQADLPDKSRLGWAVTAVFLEVNGFSVSHASVEEVYDLVTKVRSNTLWLHEIARELRAIAESPKNKRM